MPLPMVHLLTARRWAQNRPALRDCPEFYLGVIAPDAIHTRPGVNRDDNPSGRVGRRPCDGARIPFRPLQRL